MRRVVLIAAISMALTSCSRGPDKKAMELAYARRAVSQSMEAYQICSEENFEDLNQCGALINLMDADERRVVRLSSR